MSKLKAKLDQAVAGNLGIELVPNSITLKEIADKPASVTGLILAYVEGDDYCYDVVPVWRYVNGMRIKIPRFHSRPIIEARLAKQFYLRYYALFDGKLCPLKVSKPSDLKARLPFKVREDDLYRSTVISPDAVMGLRKKPLLFHRRRVNYELQASILA
ncbi:hypothetical protein ST201phi2-1p066 [Pseudomonas phage 201phi2-1]|uniref:Uncharacterized protein n=1 Tax=Pseudomonas phage 201phi2-1 TaxID=198110 RepID=B3FK41_BP201|nr:hypothetical protein ST201phi2-1p066 [Pseudomonas phage 201phi2-1]ABY62899.1 hypothetical protein 201phi2-1p066 [Pseudomonas phage 201phi2-1]